MRDKARVLLHFQRNTRALLYIYSLKAVIVSFGNFSFSQFKRYALSGMVFCGHCGDIYRRVKWNNRGCKSTVWRCVSRVIKGKMDFDCPARTVKEEVLQGAVLTVVNDAYARRNAVISLLKTNIQETVFNDL